MATTSSPSLSSAHPSESESFIEKYADRMADRQAEISDRALDALDETIDKYRADMGATRPVTQPDGSIIEEPAWFMTPKDLAILIDRYGSPDVTHGSPRP